MAFLSSLDISGSALTAERLRMDVISDNIANANTTRTESGGPYRRKTVVFEPTGESSFRTMLENNLQTGSSAANGGVKVAAIEEDQSEFSTEYDPTNPDADEQGYVTMPNVDPIKETLDMMSATRAYDASLTAFNAVKNMAVKALEMGR
ncbi:MAG: flagellar basal body rod protein FlgC [Clostridiales bacterium]|jgi:flagellar basal-body rod protein FlgC|nr:flagellar basal body rod protein FlgC [Clostridiales bacterium]